MREYKTSPEKRAKSAAYYAANREKVIARVLRDREVSRAIIDEAKSVPCADCGGKFPKCCMQFHHLDPSQKTSDVANMGHPTSVRKEIAKCVVICANCHCIRHDKEENG